MTNSHLEAALHAISDGARLEQLVADLLSAEGYTVSPTGKRGADNGRDAFLNADGEHGILHCSVTEDWESKAHDDAGKAVERFDRDFDFFIFATNEDPATVMRDRVENEITEEYGMRTTIYDFETIRNDLLGTQENHTLIWEHLSVDPKSPFVDIEQKIDEKYDELIDRVASRESVEGSITEKAPLLAVHVVSHEAIQESHDRYLEDIPEPPMIGTNSYSRSSRADYRFNQHKTPSEEQIFCTTFHKDGWIEGITCNGATEYEAQENEIRYTIDRVITDFIDDSLDAFDRADILPPYYVYITLIGFEEHTISGIPGSISFTGGRPLGREEYRLNRERFDDTNANVPKKMSRSLSQIWQQTGWPHSQNYSREELDDGTYEYEWDPIKDQFGL